MSLIGEVLWLDLRRKSPTTPIEYTFRKPRFMAVDIRSKVQCQGDDIRAALGGCDGAHSRLERPSNSSPLIGRRFLVVLLDGHQEITPNLHIHLHNDYGQVTTICLCANPCLKIFRFAFDIQALDVLTPDNTDGFAKHIFSDRRERETTSFVERRGRANKPSLPRQTTPLSRYVEENYTGVLRLSAAAEKCGLSSRTLSRTFKQENGMTFRRYLSKFRVERSKILLTGTGLTIKEIAFSVGFEEVSNYCRSFKRHTGKTPADFRQSTNLAYPVVTQF